MIYDRPRPFCCAVVHYQSLHSATKRKSRLPTIPPGQLRAPTACSWRCEPMLGCTAPVSRNIGGGRRMASVSSIQISRPARRTPCSLLKPTTDDGKAHHGCGVVSLPTRERGVWLHTPAKHPSPRVTSIFRREHICCFRLRGAPMGDVGDCTAENPSIPASPGLPVPRPLKRPTSISSRHPNRV